MNGTINALLLGDVIGQPGSRALFLGLPRLIKKYNADIVVVNGENAAHGFGIMPEDVTKLLSLGVHVITTGNHVWQKHEILGTLETEQRLLRPANYPVGVPGHGYFIVETAGHEIGIINLQGRVRMSSLQCPFLIGKEIVRKIRKRTGIILVDFHAEATEEKEALGLYLDGEISVLVGTHTHIQTADERILPNGTAYITDIGMIGPADSVIGIDKEIAVRRSLTQIPIKMEVADLPAVINGVAVSIDVKTGKALGIERISEQSKI